MSGENKHHTRLIEFAIFCLFLTISIGGFLYYNQTTNKLIDDLYLWVGIGSLGLLTIIILSIANIKLKRFFKLNSSDNPQYQLIEQAAIVLDSIGEGVAAIDKQKNISFINPEAKKIVGWNDSDVIGIGYVSVFDFVNANGTPIAEENDPILRSLVNHKRVSSRNYSVKTIGGKIIPISILINSLQNGSGTVIVTFRNISLELEEEREQREFISTASHEMRTPVAAIEGYLGLVLNPKIAQIDAKGREYIEKAQESSKHLGELFRNLLNISKAEDGRMLPKLEVINLIEFIAQIYSEFLDSAKSKEIKMIYSPISTDGGAKLSPVIYVESDRSLLREVASNLIENAIKYTTEGTVTVDVTVDDKNNAILRVGDTGIGIPTEDLPHLFQKFYRVDNSQTREINGTGLGLYLTRRIVENLHGRIWVDSKFGQGSTFSVSLPRLSNNQAEILLKSKNVTPNQTQVDLNLKDLSLNPYTRPQFQVPEGYEPTPMSNYTAPAKLAKPDQPTTMSNYQPSSERQIDPALAERLRAMGYTPNLNTGSKSIDTDKTSTSKVENSNQETEKA